MTKNSATGTPVLFLDRDGTINIDIGPKYVSKPDEIQLIPGAGVAIARAKMAGFKIAIVTNQAGVAKGFTQPRAFPAIHGQLEQLIRHEAGLSSFHFDDIRICMHHPDDHCDCRKPEIENLNDSIEALKADVSRSFFVGDKETDLICAARVGMRAILVRTGNGAKTEAVLSQFPEAKPIAVVDSLTEAVELVIGLRDAGSH